MTKEERQEYLKENRPVKKHPIANLVEDGTLTQEQADALRELMPHKGFKGGHR